MSKLFFVLLLCLNFKVQDPSTHGVIGQRNGFKNLLASFLIIPYSLLDPQNILQHRDCLCPEFLSKLNRLRWEGRCQSWRKVRGGRFSANASWSNETGYPVRKWHYHQSFFKFRNARYVQRIECIKCRQIGGWQILHECSKISTLTDQAVERCMSGFDRLQNTFMLITYYGVKLVKFLQGSFSRQQMISLATNRFIFL